VNNWGTKWDISPYECEIENGQLVGSFDSPWGPPLEAYAKLEELGFEVRAYYHECGMGFAGVYEGFDEFYDYSGMSADEAEEYLPEPLNEMYCITENMREWEAENEDE
jgi:phage repressor protein C with HTH and peptisase S24 domain